MATCIPRVNRLSTDPWVRGVTFYVIIKDSQVYCALRTLGLSRDENYLSSRSRLWVVVDCFST